MNTTQRTVILRNSGIDVVRSPAHSPILTWHSWTKLCRQGGRIGRYVVVQLWKGSAYSWALSNTPRLLRTTTNTRPVAFITTETKTLFAISGFCSSANEIFVLLGCYTTLVGSQLPTSFWLLNPWWLDRCVGNYQSTLRNIPEELTSKVLCYFVLHLLNSLQTIHPLP